MTNKKSFFHCLFLVAFFLVLQSCSVPAPAYNLQTPLNLQCSIDYDPNLGYDNGTWSSTCTGASNTWIRFYSYISAPDFSGWVFYFDSGGTTDWQTFDNYVISHIVNGSIIDLPANIIPYTDGMACHDLSHPTIPVNPAPGQFTGGYTISGLSDYPNKLTEIIIPPFGLCGQTGSIAVTAADYLNVAESPPSNIITVN